MYKSIFLQKEEGEQTPNFYDGFPTKEPPIGFKFPPEFNPFRYFREDFPWWFAYYDYYEGYLGDPEAPPPNEQEGGQPEPNTHPKATGNPVAGLGNFLIAYTTPQGVVFQISTAVPDYFKEGEPVQKTHTLPTPAQTFAQVFKI